MLTDEADLHPIRDGGLLLPDAPAYYVGHVLWNPFMRRAWNLVPGVNIPEAQPYSLSITSPKLSVTYTWTTDGTNKVVDVHIAYDSWKVGTDE
jgi:hypothetical protein